MILFLIFTAVIGWCHGDISAGTSHGMRHHDDLDFESALGIFIPAGKYGNIDGMIQFAEERRSLAGKRSGSAVALPKKVSEIAKDGTVDYTTGVNCVLTVSGEAGKRKLAVKSCAERLPLSHFLTWFYNDKVNVDDASKNVIQSQKIIFKSMAIAATTVTFEGTGNGEDYTHIESMITMRDVVLDALTLDIDISTAPKMKELVFKMTSEFHELAVTLESKAAKAEVEIKMKTGIISMKDFVNFWKIILAEMAPNDIGFTTGAFKSLQMADPVIHGVFLDTGDFQILSRFSSSDPDAFTEHKATVFFVIDKPVGKLISAALLTENPTIVKIQNQLKVYTQYPYSDPQFAKNLARPWIFSASDAEFKLIPSADYVALYNGIVLETVDKGINIYIKVNIKASLAACDAKSVTSLQKLPADGIIPIRVQLTSSSIKHLMPTALAGDLPAMMKCVDKGAAELPQSIFGSYRSPFDFKEILVNPFTGKRKVVVVFPKVINLFGPVNITNPEFSISRDKTGSAWTFEGKAPISIGPNITSSVIISLDSEKTFKCTISIPAMDIDSLGKAFGADPFKDPKIAPYKKALNLGVQNLNIEAEKAYGDPASGKVTVTGIPVINGITNVSMALYLWTPDDPMFGKDSAAEDDDKDKPGRKRGILSRKGIAIGIVIKNIRLDLAIQRMTRKNITAAWFSKATFVVMISNAFKNHCTNPKNSQRPECKSEEDKQAEAEEKRKKDREELAAKNLAAKELKDKDKPAPKEEEPVINPTEDKKTTTEKIAEEEDKNKDAKKKEDEENAKEEDTKDAMSDEEKKAEDEMKNPDDDEDDDAKKEGKHFTAIAELKDIPIKRGMQIQAFFRLPSDCKTDSLCTFMVSKVGQGAEIVLKGEFTTKDIIISAEINMNIKLNNNTELRNVKLLVQAGAVDNKVEISGKFIIKKPALILTASIALSFTGKLEIGATMAGMITNPMGLKWLALGNLLLKLGITLTGIPAFQIGATIWVGKFETVVEKGKNKTVATSDVFKFQGYYGFDPSDLTKTYFYARSYGLNLTVGNIFKVLGINYQLPQKLNETGFYGETKFSVNLGVANKEIEEFGISIPPGFAFKGDLLFFNYSISCDCKYDWQGGAFYLNAKFAPIDDWANGLITIVRSPENRKDGPMMLVDIDPSKYKKDIKIEGYMHIMGIKAYVLIRLSDTEFLLNITGSLWGVLKAQVLVWAEFESMRFTFKGCLQFDLREIMKAVENALGNAQKAAQKAFDGAHAKMAAAKQSVEAAREKVEGWKRSITEYQNKLKKRAEELEQKKAAMQNSCKDECGQICIPFLDWNKHCWKVWGYWVGCPSWNHCKWKAPHLICIAGCEIKKAFNKFLIWAEQIGLKIMLGLSELGKKLLDGADFVLQIAKGVISAADGVLSFVNAVTQGFLELGKKIASFVGNIIVINQFCVHGKLDPAKKACMGVYWDIKILYSNFKYNGTICLDLNVYEKLGEDAAEKEVPGAKTLNKEIEQIDAKVATVASDHKKLDDEASKTKANVEKETSGDVDLNFQTKRSHVPTKEELYYYKLAYDHIPNYDIRNIETVSAMKEAVPWMMDDTKGVERSIIEDHMSHAQLEPEESDDACKQHENVISRYTTITHGFHSMLNGVANQKEGYMKQKRSYMQGMSYLNELIDKEASRNMTAEERDDAAYWKNYANEHVTEYVKNAEQSLKAERRHYVTNFRDQTNEMITKKKGVGLVDYVKKLQGLAESAQKRSDVNNTEGNSSLEKLQALITKITSSENVKIRDLTKHVEQARALLTSLKRSSIPCAA